MNKTILTGICVILAALPCWASAATDMLSQTYTVERGGQLTVQADEGNIEVLTASQNTVQITVVREAAGGEEIESGFDIQKLLRKKKIVFSQNGDEVRVESATTKETEGAMLRLHFTITVPRSYNVNLTTGAGNIRVTGLRGTVEARSSGGDLTFTNIEGPVDAHTSGGKIDASNCSDKLDLQSSGGDLTINDFSGAEAKATTAGGNISVNKCSGKLSVKTSGGDITMNRFNGPSVFADTSGGVVNLDLSQEPAGDCYARSSGGNITVRIPESLTLKLRASTDGGEVTSAIPITDESKKNNGTLEGKINGGGPTLFLHTGGGNIRLIK